MYIVGRYGSKGYTSVILNYFEVTFLKEKEDAALCPSVNYVLVVYGVAVSEQYVVEFPCFFYTSGGISSRPAAFLFFNFS